MEPLVTWIEAHPLAGALVFLGVATLGKVTPLPGGALILLSGGFLFGPVLGPVLGVVGAALSALLVAVVGQRLLFERLSRRFGPRLLHIERAVGEDGFWWLLSARLVPLLPAWLVNLVPVLFPIRLRAVFLATLIGLTPIAFVLGSIGDSLSSLTRAESVAEARLSPTVLLPLAGLALLSLVPVIVKRVRAAR